MYVFISTDKGGIQPWWLNGDAEVHSFNPYLRVEVNQTELIYPTFLPTYLFYPFTKILR